MAKEGFRFMSQVMSEGKNQQSGLISDAEAMKMGARILNEEKQNTQKRTTQQRQALSKQVQAPRIKEQNNDQTQFTYTDAAGKNHTESIAWWKFHAKKRNPFAMAALKDYNQGQAQAKRATKIVTSKASIGMKRAANGEVIKNNDQTQFTYTDAAGKNHTESIAWWKFHAKKRNPFAIAALKDYNQGQPQIEHRNTKTDKIIQDSVNELKSSQEPFVQEAIRQSRDTSHQIPYKYPPSASNIPQNVHDAPPEEANANIASNYDKRPQGKTYDSNSSNRFKMSKRINNHDEEENKLSPENCNLDIPKNQLPSGCTPEIMEENEIIIKREQAAKE